MASMGLPPAVPWPGGLKAASRKRTYADAGLGAAAAESELRPGLRPLNAGGGDESSSPPAAGACGGSAGGEMAQQAKRLR